MVNSATRVLVDQSLLAGNAVSFTVPTDSMSPFLVPGDQIIVRAIKATELRIGDLIVWRAATTDDTQSAWIVHRLIERRIVDGELFLTTQGDNASFADKPITESQVCGVVTRIQHRDSRRLMRYGSTRARWAGWWLAALARFRSLAQTKLHGLPRRIVVKALRVAGFGFGKIARVMVG